MTVKPMTKRKSTGVIDRLQRAEPRRNVVFIAVDKIETIGDMVRFFDAYVTYLKRHGENAEIRKNPEKVATENIRAVLWQVYSAEINSDPNCKKWLSVVDDIARSEYTGLRDASKKAVRAA